jgi:integrase
VTNEFDGLTGIRTRKQELREKLTAAFCIETKKSGYHADGGGLYLNVKPDGRKYWCFRWRDRHIRYTTEKSQGVGKLREKGLGPFGEYDISLSGARKLAGECRQLLRHGKDPIAEARRTAQKSALDLANELTFGICAMRFINTHKAGWRNEKHAAQWSATLNKYAAPIMMLPVDDIDTTLVLSCLEPIWTSKTETATRVRQRIETVLNWAAVRKFRSGENPARWRGHLDKFLPRPTKLKNVKQRPAMDYRQLGAFIPRLRAVKSLAANALELQILTATRPGDVVGARWSEFGLVGKVWTIPAERMKADQEHSIPLSSQALQLLKQLPQNNEFVFPGVSLKKGISTAALMKLIKQIEPGITAQGFRSTFRDWAVNQTAYPREVIEYALAQQLKDEAAHLRSDLIARRAQLMRDWANFCDT